MKIESSALQMQAQHVASRVDTQSSRFEAWVGERRPTSAPGLTRASPAVQISSAARVARAAQEAIDPTHAADAAPGSSPSDGLTPQLAMIRDLIARMTGVQVRVYTGQTDPAPSPPASRPATTPTADAGRPRAGWGLLVEQREVVVETESTQFATQGTVRTADGREIRFSLQLDMQRSYRQESSFSLRLGDAVAVDPLVINFDGSAAQLQDLRFEFDLDSDGQTDNVPLLSGNRGYLALDLNHNSRIDNGRELFGPGTGNGFAELAAYDSDGNGWIDEADPVFQQLQVWTPSADGAEGAEGAGSLRTLADVGVGALSTNAVATPFALRAADNASLGTVRSTSAYLRENGSVGTVQQVDLTV
ncbi:hypothetical protein DBR23_14170 [Acidovorax sp. HMWF018]|uniref:hypothetical protein n=1 Tax=Acidovorax sp. HMWF018 TaxID=2056855 RepID=UPI000D36C5F2|nr:hypothetical protein [Acidovorax sp. HMWF018]PTT38419.1 hypothetical protein DBR23_14170 [Acidovorax sp. HMWF018]